MLKITWQLLVVGMEWMKVGFSGDVFCKSNGLLELMRLPLGGCESNHPHLFGYSWA